MSELSTSKAKPARARRHPLLYHQRLNEQYFWPATSIVLASAALLVWNPPKVEPYRLFLVAALVCCALVLVLTFAFRLRAYVTCTADAVHVRLPFYRFDVPYDDIKNVRPTELFRLYTPRGQTWGQRRFLEPLFGATVLVLELDALPEHTSWLRFWMSKYMVSPEATGLVIAVRDWMGFRAELDDLRAKSRRHLAERRRSAPVR